MVNTTTAANTEPFTRHFKSLGNSLGNPFSPERNITFCCCNYYKETAESNSIRGKYTRSICSFCRCYSTSQLSCCDCKCQTLPDMCVYSCGFPLFRLVLSVGRKLGFGCEYCWVCSSGCGIEDSDNCCHRVPFCDCLAPVISN